MEFALMLINTRPVDDLKLNLITNEEDDKLPELIDRLDDIKDDLATYGIDFEYKFRDFHDRCTKQIQAGRSRLDVGWICLRNTTPFQSLRQDRICVSVRNLL